MKMLLCLALLVGTLTSGLVAQSAKSGRELEPSFSIALRAPETTVKADAEVELDVTLKNTSHRDITVGEILGGSDLNYNIEVRDGQGKLAPETPFGKKLHGKDPNFQGQHGSILAHTLAPGASHETKTFLNKVYVLNEAGTYTVQASRRDPDSNVVIKSNSITLTVIP
ncbi:MAG: hypothetical protein ACLQAT_02305 [Candidatus Binataceae bacterium]